MVQARPGEYRALAGGVLAPRLLDRIVMCKLSSGFGVHRRKRVGTGPENGALRGPRRGRGAPRHAGGRGGTTPRRERATLDRGTRRRGDGRHAAKAFGKLVIGLLQPFLLLSRFGSHRYDAGVVARGRLWLSQLRHTRLRREPAVLWHNGTGRAREQTLRRHLLEKAVAVLEVHHWELPDGELSTNFAKYCAKVSMFGSAIRSFKDVFEIQGEIGRMV